MSKFLFYLRCFLAYTVFWLPYAAMHVVVWCADLVDEALWHYSRWVTDFIEWRHRGNSDDLKDSRS